ncbi:hypothetical protein AB0J37_01905 [Microbispora rosea]|uniref:hypothetical protein n=1 Tax=Microbispora rosea TaxID=58117 RepID=UPI0034283C9B
MKWRWPWQWPEAAPVLEEMAGDTAGESDDCGHQELIDQLQRENDLLHQDLKEHHKHDAVTCAQRARDLDIEVRDVKWRADRLAAENDELKAEAALLRSRTPMPSREALLRERETNARLMQRINDMTRGVVTL